MGSHLLDGEFQSDKYPTCPRGKVPLSCKDPAAQDLLWLYAQRRRAVDRDFASDLEHALLLAGYRPSGSPKAFDDSDGGDEIERYVALRNVLAVPNVTISVFRTLPPPEGKGARAGALHVYLHATPCPDLRLFAFVALPIVSDAAACPDDTWEAWSITPGREGLVDGVMEWIDEHFPDVAHICELHLAPKTTP